jgi:carbon-monoxide dehydrogenase catalytic subunit
LEEKEKVSAHESIREMYERVHKEGLTNVVDRFEAQQPTRCPFCSQGLSCQLCSQGPCRITKNANRGVCGIDANGMAMRTMLLRNVLGISTYTYHAIEVAKTLKATAEGKTPFEIKDKEKLLQVAKLFGLKTSGPINDVTISVADFIIKEINRDSDEPSKMIEIFAPEKRKKVWQNLGIFPGGPLHEIKDATSSCLTNVDGDYKSLATKALRLGIACAYGALVPLELGQDILFGTPKPHESEVDLGILDSDYVNILPNGHEPFVGAALIKAAKTEKVQKMAKDAGAKGLRIIGSIETGQELQQRFLKDEVFRGLTGNWLGIEFALATGAVDLFAMDMNCSPPALGFFGEKYGATLVTVSKLVRMPGVDRHIDYKPEEVEKQAEELIKLAVENFKKRKKNVKAYVPQKRQKVIAGFSTEAILAALGGSLIPLLEAIKKGDVKGVVALVSCTTLRDSGQDVNTIAVAKELIKRNILVLSAGCGNGAVQVGGLTNLDAINLAGEGLKKVCKALNIPPVLSFGTCTDVGRLSLLVNAVAEALGVDIPALPIAVTAPQYMEQKATIDAVFAVAYGLYTHVAPTPPITGASELVRLLTEDVEGLTGGKLVFEPDPLKAVDGIEKHIIAKRKSLGLSV